MLKKDDHVSNNFGDYINKKFIIKEQKIKKNLKDLVD